MGLVLAGLTGYIRAQHKTINSYRAVRDVRYDTDGALKGAVNWVSNTPGVARDPEIYPGDPDCAYRVPSDGTSPDITVTCNAEEGSGSGAPNETGKSPDQALLLLGTRYGEVPYNSPCVGSTTDRTTISGREFGLLFDPISPNAAGNCTAGGAIGEFRVSGDVSSNSPLRANTNSDPLKLANPASLVKTGTSPIVGNQTCINMPGLTGASKCSAVAAGTRSGPFTGRPASSPWDPYETLFTDPALDGAPDRAEWRQGTINWTDPKVSINGNPVQALNLSTNLSQCKGLPSDLVRFYPGFYSDAAALNRIFNDTVGGKSCKDGVFWFGPAADAASGAADYSPATGSAYEPLDADTAQQGVYLFDFRNGTPGTNGSGRSCGYYQNTNNPHRWCLKVPATSGGPMVVGGTPQGFDPAALIGSTTPASSTMLNLTTAGGIDENGSLTWENPGSAASIDSSWARYNAVFISVDRSMTLDDFSPKVNAVLDGGRVSISVSHYEQNAPTQMNRPTVRVRTNDRGVRVDCGSFSFAKRTTATTDVLSTDPAVNTANTSTNGYDGPVGALNSADELRLRNCTSNAERVNNLELTWSVGGAWFNCLWGWICPKPYPHLNGMTVSVESPVGGWFGGSVAKPATYCDKDAAGVQFVFGGDSTIAAGSDGNDPPAIQICAGPAPSNPENYQQVAVWGQPVNSLTKESGGSQEEKRIGRPGSASLRPASNSGTGRWCPSASYPPIGGTFYDAERGQNPGNRYTNPGSPTQIPHSTVDSPYCGLIPFAVPPLNSNSWVTYSNFGDVKPYTGAGNCTSNPSVDLCYDPATEVIDKVELKVQYDSRCGIPAINGTWCSGATANAGYNVTSTSGTGCNDDDAFPANAQPLWYTVDITSCLNTVAKINAASIAFNMNCNVCTGLIDKYFHGLELIVHTRPIATNTKVVSPSRGCLISPTGYGAGIGDYAAVSTDNYSSTNISRDCALISGGRVSIQGTVYAPSAALEVYDGDNLYPFASRGVVARHLRVRKFQYRAGYNEPVIVDEADKTPNPRQTEFVACERSGSSTAPCGDVAGDKLLGSANARFELDGATSTAEPRIPKILDWTATRTYGS
ncbi:MAG: hypothetical protein M9922_13765 [Microthrixaceae bacterium]|nr:hypothetical protein [Microthrixaceae bacterium]